MVEIMSGSSPFCRSLTASLRAVHRKKHLWDLCAHSRSPHFPKTSLTTIEWLGRLFHFRKTCWSEQNFEDAMHLLTILGIIGESNANFSCRVCQRLK
jgi:hypothetical protein